MGKSYAMTADVLAARLTEKYGEGGMTVPQVWINGCVAEVEANYE